MTSTGLIGAENNVLEMGRVEFRIDHRRVKPGIREWAIIGNILPHSDNHRMLQALKRELDLPDAMNVGTNPQQIVSLLEYVRGPLVLVGPGALALWRPDLVQAKCAWTMDGHCGVWWDQRAVLTCRELTPPKSIQPFKLLWELLQHDAMASEFVSRRCVQCGNPWAHWDRDAVPYCEAHWQREMGKWEIARDQKSRIMDVNQPF